MNSNFSDNLKKIRKDNNLSQEDLAEKLNVSRQSVSKWESGLAYPEMDKVLQICKLFNLNIDELLNQDITDIKETKESKNKVNKYIDDFLNFITKTINLFSSMKFIQKVKCILEQFVIIMLLILIFFIVGTIMSEIISNLIRILPDKLYYFVYGILEDVYLIAYVIFAFIIIIHIFKVRYLDYYEIMTEDNENLEKAEEKSKKIFNKENEKIIIRDPKHSEYRFINALLKCLLFIIKCFAFGIFLFASFLICLVIFTLFIALYHIFINPIFLSVSIVLLGIIVVGILFLISLFSFIFNKKFPAKKIFIIFLFSLVLGGVGTGLTFINFLKLDVNYELKNNKSISETFKFAEKIEILNFDNIKFTVDDSLKDDIKVTIFYSDDIMQINGLEVNDEGYLIYNSTLIEDMPNIFYKKIISNLKENKLNIDKFIKPEIEVVTNDTNIKKLIKNMSENRLTNLKVVNNTYYLSFFRDNVVKNNNYCKLEDYYYNCINVSKSSSIENEFIFTYNGEKLEYDKNNYICDNYNNKKFYCYKKN